MLRNDKKQIFGWLMYDWANSAFVTTVAVGVLPVYFADVVVPSDGFIIGGTVLSAIDLWGIMLSTVALVVFLLAPVLGAIADISGSKKKFLLSFCYGGSLFGILLYFCGSGEVWQTMIFFSLAQFGFVGANVFYDAFLSNIAPEEKLDWISGKGYAYGYAGGGLQFGCSLGLVAGHELFGISQAEASRLAMTFAGVWWAGFSLFTAYYLKEHKPEEITLKENSFSATVIQYVTLGISQTLTTLKKVKQQKHLLIFLIAFMIYNDGVQTVISMGIIYGKQELQLTATTLMVTLLIIQAVAFFGALLFSKLGELTSSKTALMTTLALWSSVVIYAYFIDTTAEFLFLGITIGIVMGGSQSLSRSLYSSIIPINATAEYFGFYSVFNKFSAIWGPSLFVFIRQLTGSYRNSILSIVFFFIIGMILLAFMNVEKARKGRLQL